MGFLKDKPKALYLFRVVTKGHIYLLSAKSQALKQDWMKASAEFRKASGIRLRFLWPNPYLAFDLAYTLGSVLAASNLSVYVSLFLGYHLGCTSFPLTSRWCEIQYLVLGSPVALTLRSFLDQRAGPS